MATLPPTGSQLQADETVRHALQQAWNDSQPGDPLHRHEEGGWILWNRESHSIRIFRVPSGTRAALTTIVGTRPENTPDEQVVGWFHTHPNPPQDDRPGNKTRWDQDPSSADINFSMQHNLPGLVVTRTGIYVFGPDRAPMTGEHS